jgi:dGTPase
MSTPTSAQEEFDSRLAPYAVRHDNSLGRRYSEPSALDRNEFQRDSTRVMHSSTFRRLQYKTQVFSNHEGDLFRTRLTHSLEVAQVSRASARALKLNEDLVETLALAHDLGHAPFGHLGQDALNEAMKTNGGYEHNFQALRVVDELERAYTGFQGLNLLFESREGVLKHCSAKNARLLVDQAASTKDPLLAKIVERFLSTGERSPDAYQSPSLEAQLTDWCDAIAYTHADMEDAVTMGVLTLNQLSEGVPLFRESYDVLRKRSGSPRKADEPLYAKEISGMMMKHALSDLIDNSRFAINKSKIETIGDVRASKDLIGFSMGFLETHHIPFKRYLREEVYTHPNVERWRSQQKDMMLLVFAELCAHPSWVQGFDKEDKRGLHRQLCDHIAAMTDRSFTKEFERVSELAASKGARKALRKVK